MQVLHILGKKIPTSVSVKMCKIYSRMCKGTVTVHICTVTVQCVNNFLFFFSPSSIKLQQISAARKKNIPAPAPALVPPPPPNYNKPNHQSQRHHQTPQPSTEKYPKINRNSKINRTQNQQKTKNQPNSKSIKTHLETQPKNSTHLPENPAQRSRICHLICCHCCCRVFHCCRRIFHCCRRLEVGGEGSVVEERGRAKAKGRPNRLVAEAVMVANWE